MAADPRWRRLPLAAAALLLGLATTIAVSWGLTLRYAYVGARDGGWTSGRTFIPPHRVRGPWGEIGVSASHDFGESEVWVYPPWAVTPGNEGSFAVSYPLPWDIDLAERKGLGDPPYHIPAWAAWPRSTSDGQFATFCFGWPCRSLAYSQEILPKHMTKGAMQAHHRGVWRLPFPNSSWLGTWLPLFPAWPGFVIDLALWASLWWAALVGFGAIRAARRRSRNLCSRCAYDLSGTPVGLPCPECGQP